MGWFAYDIYGGDDTQTRHYDFLKWSDTAKENQIMEEDWLMIRKTKIPKQYIDKFVTGVPKILKKIKPRTPKHWNDDSAIEWQMLLALFLDNDIKPPLEILNNGISATEYLMGEHAADFDNTSLRRRNLRNFIKKAKKYA